MSGTVWLASSLLVWRSPRSASMKIKPIALLLAGAIAAFAYAAPAPAHAMITRPRGSFVVPTGDGKRMLVMLASMPVAQDEGNTCTLPDGREVRLRETFPSSGLYEIGSTAPIWTVDWYGDRVYVSHDGRYTVCVNDFGGGGPGGAIVLRWGIRFYDSGNEIKSYHVAELVEYPSLMPFTTVNWHLLWVDDAGFDTESCDGSFVLNTSTHETYRFDAATGEIVEEYRLWRRVVRGGAALLIVLVVFAGWLVFRARRRRRSVPVGDLPVEASCGQPARRARKLSFSLRSLMIVVTLTAVFCAMFRAAPHVGVLVSAAACTAVFTRRLIRVRRRAPRGPSGAAAKGRRAMLWLLTAVSWLSLYALSFAPVRGLMLHFDVPEDVQQAVAITVYAPAYWLYRHARPPYDHVVADYFRAWRF